MGQAFDRDGLVLGVAFGETKREVFDTLSEQHPDAHKIRIKTLENQSAEGDANKPEAPAPTLYPKSVRVRQQIEKSFNYHAPHGDQPARYVTIRAAALELADIIATLTPESREQSNALTRLDEVVMHANAAIARNEPRA